MTKSNKIYDGFKLAGGIILPAIAALYASLAGIWGFPLGTEISGSIAALAAFINSILKYKSDQFWKEHDIY